MLFKELDLDPKILRALEDCEYSTATEIQEKTITAFKEGKHIVGQSQTGSGKTAAFVLPVLNSIDVAKRHPQALILAPTRELAAQIREEIYTLSKHMRMMSLACVGGTSKRKQIEILRKGPQIIVGTPGRIEDLIDSRFIKLNHIKYFVLDEVDRMLDMGFVDTIRSIWQRLDTVEQTLTFSATLPREVQSLLTDYVGDDYINIKISEQIVVDKVDHMFMNIEKDYKYEVLSDILRNNPEFKVIVFAETKRMVDQLARDLYRDGFAARGLHGDMEQRERFRTLKNIKSGETNILVATDVAARGLNMNKVNLVINYEAPNDPESYVHRIGRTARAGASGNAIMFISKSEWSMLHNIEKRNKLRIKQINVAGEQLERTDKPQRSTKSRNRFSRYRRSGSGGGNRGNSRGGYRGGRGGNSGNSRGGNRSSGSYNRSRSSSR